jgi:succinate-semialdehyde dehydrogenase/glutarate-semialdehyde dehydrogenase
LLFRVRDVEEAIAVANDTPFGLGASVWTSSGAEQRRFTVGLQCGSVFVNAPVASDPRLPFGGVKHSGYGRELSAAGMREFLNAKTVVIAEPVIAAPPSIALSEPPTADAAKNGPLAFRTILEEQAKASK